MSDKNVFNDVSQKIAEKMPSSVKNFQSDMEQNIKSIMLSTFNKMDLVTREEFDKQVKLLEKSREKIDQLEKEVNQLKNEKMNEKTEEEEQIAPTSEANKHNPHSPSDE
jgi:BMFP domain-containing protein YqiC